jgi:hypothetical protein
METTTQEMAVTDTSATSRTGGLQDRKIGQPRMPNRTIQFPRRQQQLLVISTSEGAEGWIFCWSIREQSGEYRVKEQIFG